MQFNFQEQQNIISAISAWLWENQEVKTPFDLDDLVKGDSKCYQGLTEKLTDLSFAEGEVRFICSAFWQWLNTALEADYHMPGIDYVAAAVPNSLLLRRLLAGQEPHHIPPPTTFSFPWYDLVDHGTATGNFEIRKVAEGSNGGYIMLNRAKWKIEKKIASGEFILSYRPDAPKYHLTQLTDNPGEVWHKWTIEEIPE